jgi:DNA-binding CsgD family transcriptional regulator
MVRSKHLRLSDIESVFHLVDECRELWADADAWQMHLLQGACRLTGTAVGHYNEQRLAPDLRSTEILDESFCGGWRDAAARACMFRMYTEHVDRTAFFPKCTQLAGQALLGRQVTTLRPHMRPDREWYGGSFFNEYRRPAYVDGFILSFALNPLTGSLVMLTTNQDLSDPQPTPHAGALLALLTRQFAPLVGTVLTTRRQRGLRGLSPRLRQTLDRLLAGDSEKQIAGRLALGRTTVHDYIGAIYRHFHVGTRGELLAYFLRRRPLPSSPAQKLAHGTPASGPVVRRRRTQSYG